jgi:hypothetical protein
MMNSQNNNIESGVTSDGTNMDHILPFFGIFSLGSQTVI